MSSEQIVIVIQELRAIGGAHQLRRNSLSILRRENSELCVQGHLALIWFRIREKIIELEIKVQTSIIDFIIFLPIIIKKLFDILQQLETMLRESSRLFVELDDLRRTQESTDAIRSIRLRMSSRRKNISLLNNPSLLKPLPVTPSGMWTAAQTYIAAHRGWNSRHGCQTVVIEDFDKRIFMVSSTYVSSTTMHLYSMSNFFQTIFTLCKFIFSKKHFF